MKSATQILKAFYDAEGKYMKERDRKGQADFAGIAAVLHPEVVLHQSPDLPFGGEYVGQRRYEEWAIAMSSMFDELEVYEQDFYEKGDVVVATCMFKTRSRQNRSQQDLPMVQVVRVKDGKIVEFRPFYWNVPEYVAAAGPEVSGSATREGEDQ